MIASEDAKCVYDFEFMFFTWTEKVLWVLETIECVKFSCYGGAFVSYLRGC